MGPTQEDAIPRLLQQIGIIKSTKCLLESNIHRIKEILQDDIFDNELKSANKINELVYKGENLLQEIYKDIDKKKNNDWYITKEIKEWCLNDRERNKIVIEFLKQDGVITWRSACRIQENNFVKMVLEKLKECFNNSNIQSLER